LFDPCPDEGADEAPHDRGPHHADEAPYALPDGLPDARTDAVPDAGYGVVGAVVDACSLPRRAAQ